MVNCMKKIFFLIFIVFILFNFKEQEAQVVFEEEDIFFCYIF